MTITKCDICTKQIKWEDHQLSVSVRTPADFSHFMFCNACGKSIMALLSKHSLLDGNGAPRKPRSRHVNRRAT